MGSGTRPVQTKLLLIPYVHAEGIQNEHLKKRKTDVHAEHARKELMRMLRVRISS